MKTPGLLSAAIAGVALLSACGGGGTAAETSTAPATTAVSTLLKPAYDSCAAKMADALADTGRTPNEYLRYGDDGSLFVTTPSDSGTAALYVLPALKCVLDELAPPDAIEAKIESAWNTSSNFNGEWAGIVMDMNYNGDSLNAVFTTNS